MILVNSMLLNAALGLMFLYSALVDAKPKSRIPKKELDPEYWIRSGQEELLRALDNKVYKGEAKNVILFLGDGMGLSTITASRIYKGQLAGRPGEEERLVFEDFPNVALAKTYNVDHQIPDSAATATAFLCGVKGKFGTVGLDPRATRRHCQRSKGKNATCILELFQKAGKSTGIVTTTRISHATPAPLYSWAADRDWEDDSHLPHSAIQHGCQDTAAQLVSRSPGNNINVIFAGGRRNLMSTKDQDPEYPSKYGHRKDGRNLIYEWLQENKRRKSTAKFVWNSTEFNRIPDDTDHVMGLFEPSHMQFNAQRSEDPGGEPSLADMTEKAIRILDQKKTGYFLLVEGGRIDHAHHGNSARVAMEETLAMEEAVARALSQVNVKDTLVIVTADHSHPLNINSYATRGNPILGLTDYSDSTAGDKSDIDHLPYTTLNYGNGPGNEQRWPRKDLSFVNTEAHMYQQVSAIPLKVSTHEGSDVPVYATGPWAHLFTSTHEQHYIFHVMAYASCTQHPTAATSNNARPAHCSSTSKAPATADIMALRGSDLYRIGKPAFSSEHLTSTSSATRSNQYCETVTTALISLLTFVLIQTHNCF